MCRALDDELGRGPSEAGRRQAAYSLGSRGQRPPERCALSIVVKHELNAVVGSCQSARIAVLEPRGAELVGDKDIDADRVLGRNWEVRHARGSEWQSLYPHPIIRERPIESEPVDIPTF